MPKCVPWKQYKSIYKQFKNVQCTTDANITCCIKRRTIALNIVGQRQDRVDRLQLDAMPQRLDPLPPGVYLLAVEDVVRASEKATRCKYDQNCIYPAASPKLYGRLGTSEQTQLRHLNIVVYEVALERRHVSW